MKKNIVKLGACSLLVGLLALTACGKKKKVTKDDTTVKTTTTENTTTEQTTPNDNQKQVKGFNVYVDNVLAPTSGNNAVIEFEYSDGYDYLSHIKVELVYDDDTKEEITTGFNVVTDITETSGCVSATEPGMYNLAISYGTFDAVNIDLIVNQKEVDMSNVAWDYTSALTYNGEEQTITVKNLPKGVVASYTNNKATNAGDYKANVTFEAENFNYKIDVTSLDELDWTINKLVVDINDLTWNIENGAHLTYNGDLQEVILTNVPQGVVVNYYGNALKNAGSTLHTAVAEFESNPNIQYGSTGSLTCEYYIDKLYVDVDDLTWNYTGPVTYDEEEHEVIINNLPKGLEVSYSNNVATNAGNYEAVATFTEDSGNIEFKGGKLSCSCPWIISRRTREIDIDDIELIYSDNFDEETLYYTGETYTIRVNEESLPSGVTVSSYENGDIVNAGTYVFRAYLEGDSNTDVSPAYIEKTITIEKVDVEITSITNPSKAYDGEEITIEFETNVSASAVISYKQYDSDEEYTTNAPVNAGLYTAKIVIDDTTNYNGCEEIVNFEIYKKVIQAPKSETISNCTGSDQTFSPEGFDSSIMEFVNGSDDAIQKNIGKYYYDIKLKDEAKANYTFYEFGNSVSCTWHINGNLNDYLEDDSDSEGIHINNEPFTIKNFEALEYLKDGDTIYVNMNSSYHVTVNGSPIDLDGPAEYTVSGDSEVAFEIVDQYGGHYYYKVLKVYNSNLMYSIFIDDEEYVVDNNPIFYNTDSDEITLDFDNINFDDISRLEVNGKEVTLGNTTVVISVDDIENNRIEVKYYCYEDDENESYFGFFIFVNQDVIVASLDINLLDTTGTDGNTGKSIHIENDGYGTPTYDWESKAIELNFNDSTILDIKVNLMDGYENYTYGFYYYYSDEYDNEECDFTNCNITTGNNLIYLICFNEDGEVAYRISLVINCNQISFNEYSGIAETYGEYYLVTNDGSFAKGTSEYNSSWDGFDYYVSDTKMDDNYWTYNYTSKGVYREKLQLKTTHLGVEYVRYINVYVIYTDSVDTYAKRIGLSYEDEDGNTTEIYNGLEDDAYKYIIDYDKDGYRVFGTSLRYLTELSVEENIKVDANEGYEFNLSSSKITFDGDNECIFVKYAFTGASDTNYEVYAIVFYSGKYSNNTNIIGEKIVGCNEFIDEEAIDFNIDNNVVNITNAAVFFEYNIKLEEECSYELYDSNDDCIVSSDGTTSAFTLGFANEGTYYLYITASAGETREIIINVSGNFGNFIETSIGENGTVLYLDSDYDGNFIITDGPNGTSVKGYYGSDSQNYISNGQVEINIDGVLVDYLYKDSSFNEKITRGTDTLDVHDIDTKPYVEIYMPNYGKVILYLIDKPLPKAIITFGEDEEYGFIFNENEFETDAPEYYYPIAMINEYCDSMTLTLTQAYNDYSYSIIVGDADFITSIMFKESGSFDYTFAELEENNHLYRVDSNTLTVDIPIQYMYFFISAEGVTGTDKISADNIMPVLISDVSVFDFDGYYLGLYLSSDDDWSSYYNCDDDDCYGELANSFDTFIPSECYYHIGEAEINNIEDGKYTFSYSSNLSAKLYSDKDCEHEIDVTNGLVTLDVLNDDDYFCEVYVKADFADDPIKVVLVFIDPEELPDDFPED